MLLSFLFMVGSSFILTRRHGRLTLLNTTEIAAAYTEEVDRTTRRGRNLYTEYDAEVTIFYTVQVMLTGRREMEYVFANLTERDALFEEIRKALSPSVTIDIAEPLIKQVITPAGPPLDSSIVYNGYTAEEIEHAMAMLREMRTQESAPSPAPMPTAAEPSRKPRTPRK